MRYVIGTVLFIFLAGFQPAKTDKPDYPPFTFKHYHDIANYFNSLEEVRNFFDFKKHETVVDIGAGDGRYEAIFSLFADSVSFWAEDIDSKSLTQERMNRYVKQYGRMRKTAQTNTFQTWIGGERSTNLRDGTFDKAIMMTTFHEFTYADEMIEDIKRILKPGGKVYVLDTKCLAKGHKSYLPMQVVEKWASHGYKLLSIDTTNAHESEDRYKAVFLRKQ